MKLVRMIAAFCIFAAFASTVGSVDAQERVGPKIVEFSVHGPGKTVKYKIKVRQMKRAFGKKTYVESGLATYEAVGAKGDADMDYGGILWNLVAIERATGCAVIRETIVNDRNRSYAAVDCGTSRDRIALPLMITAGS